jgi:hypothetical protein
MAVDEQARFELHARLEHVLGAEHAATLMEHLPPVGWADVATKHDFGVLDRDLRRGLLELEARSGLRFDAVDQRFDAFQQHLDDRLEALEQRVLAAFRGELVAAVTAQTRMLVVALLGTLLTVAGIALAAVGLA